MKTIAIQMNANLDMTLNRSMNHTQSNRAGRLATLGLCLLLAGLTGTALAAGNAPTKTGPGAPIFTQGNPAYQGLSNAQSNVSANAPAGAAANLTGMVNQPPTISWVTPSNTVITAPASVALAVNAADPDGSVARVDYYNGSTLIGSSTSAPFGITWSNVGAGQYTLTAIATDNLGMSTTTAAITVIANAPPSISLNPPAGPLYSPASITLTANASDTDGSISKVEYYNGSTLIGSSTSSPYSISWTSVPVGNYSLTAIATDNYGASTTASAIAVNVILTPSSTALNATSPATVGQATTLTASVTGYNPSGTVTFKDGANTIGSAPINAGSNTASLNYTFTSAGSHSITASYGGDANNTISTSIATSLTVNPVATTTTLSATPNPATAGQATTLSASVTGVNATGTVIFKDGATTLGTGTLNTGSASLSYTFNTAGAHSITAEYAGDANNAASTALPASLTVNQAATSISLAVNPNPVAAGQVTTLTASVIGVNPSGTVTFNDGATTIGTAPINAGSASLNYTFTAAGVHSITASYGGDANNTTSTSAATSETVSPVVSTTSLSITPNPAKVGQVITLSASVNGLNPTGNVTFLDGTTTLGTATLTAGTASFNTSFTSPGNHSLSAAYAGDNSNAGSASGQISLTLSSGVAQAYYIHTDQLNTPREITDGNGNVVWQWDNTDPFGNNVPNENPNGAGRFSFNLRFPGQYADQETNTYYNVNRDYDASIGRYIESDPFGLAGGINTYGYVLGNPLSYTDPLGLDPNQQCVAACTAAGASVGGGLGAAGGTVVGGALGGAAGGAGGTLVAPGPGTIGGGAAGGTAGAEIGGAVGGAVGAGVGGLIGNAVGKAVCPDDKKENKCDLHLDAAATAFSMKRPGNTYACVYKQSGSFGMFTFPQWKGLPCYPVNQEKCMVDTSTMDPGLYGR